MIPSLPIASALVRPRETKAVVRAVVELAKPGITRMVLITTALGVLAAPGDLVWLDLIATLVGTGLVVAGANALNMFLERDVDALMTRTRNRPLPTGRLSPDEALAFGMIVSILGLYVLAQFVSSAAVGLAAVALLSYVLIYTPLKRVSSFALYVGAVPGALPPAIGYAAVTGTLDGIGLCLFLTLLVWQLPHFLAITLFRSEEYGRAGLKVLPNERGVLYTKKVALALSFLLLAVTLLPLFIASVSFFYAFVAGFCGIVYVAWAARGLRPESGEKWARGYFFASMPYLIIVMAALVLLAD